MVHERARYFGKHCRSQRLFVHRWLWAPCSCPPPGDAMSHTIDRLFAVLSFVIVGFGSLACRPLPERLVAPVGSTDTLPALEPLPSLNARPVAVLSRAPFLVQPPGPPARNITPMQVMRAEDLPRLKGKPATRTGSTSTFTAASTPARLPGSGPWMPGTLVIQTERLDLYVGKQTFSSDQVAALAPLIEQLLRDNEARFGTSLKQRVSVAFYRAGMATQTSSAPKSSTAQTSVSTAPRLLWHTS